MKVRTTNYFVTIAVCVMISFSMGATANEDTGEFIYDDHGKRDPFWRLVSPSGAINNYETEFILSDLTLEGIMSAEAGKGVAIINGRIVKQNDKIGKFVVKTIEKESVTLTKDNAEFQLNIKKGE